MEKYISDINEMLFMAYIHGGDAGGPYGVNDEGVIESIKNFLTHASLEHKYIFGARSRKYNNGIYFDVPQIIEINN